jgi:hypothetical protein
MQAFWYRLLVDINRDELRSANAAGVELANQPAPAKDMRTAPPRL